MSQISSPFVLVLDCSSKLDDIEQSLRASCSQFDLVLFVYHANAKDSFKDVDSFIRRYEPKNFHVFDLTKSLGENHDNRSTQLIQSHRLMKSLMRAGVVLYVPATSSIKTNLREELTNSIQEWISSNRPFGRLDSVPGSFAAILESGINLTSDEVGSVSISFH